MVAVKAVGPFERTMRDHTPEGGPASEPAIRAALTAWLDWYALAGVTDAVGDRPVALGAAPSPTGLGVPRHASPAAGSDPADAGSSPLPPAAVPSLLGDLPPPAGRGRPAAGSRGPGGEQVATARAVAGSCKDLAELEAALAKLDLCPLKATATRLCFADGNPDARLLLIGEAPGAEEDRQGKPFMGPSGQLLDRMLATIGLDRSLVWITNIIFWRPPGNRSPTAAEIAICQPFLERQIELLRPSYVLFVGGVAARALLGLEEGVTKLRGRPLTYAPPWAEAPIPGLVTFHPAYLLRQPLQKRLVWRDLLRLRADLEALGVLAPAMTH